MRSTTTIIRTCLLGLFFACCMACNNGSFEIDHARWTTIGKDPFVSYTIKDSVPASKTGSGKLRFEFYGWEKKGTIIAAYSNNELDNFIEIVNGQLSNNTALQQLGKTSKGFVRFDVDRYMQTTGVLQSGIPIFSFVVK